MLFLQGNNIMLGRVVIAEKTRIPLQLVMSSFSPDKKIQIEILL